MKKELFNNILLVEDNDAHAILVSRNLNKFLDNGRIHRVCDGEEAWEYLIERDECSTENACAHPNLILLDLRLPKLGGLDVLQKIKAHPRFKKIPTVILSSSAAKPDVDKAYEYNANSYVVKPLDFAKFSALLKDLCTYWNHWNTPLRVTQQ